MKITGVFFGEDKYTLKTPFVTALRRVESFSAYTVVLRDSDGNTGKGDCVPTPQITGDTAESIERDFKVLRSLVEGKEASASLGDEIASAECGSSPKAAFDIALYNLLAAEKRVPLYEYLGGAKLDFLENDVTVSLGTPDKMARDAAKAVSDGVRILKIKLGGELAADSERLFAVASAAPDALLRIDANQAWSVKQSLEVAEYIKNNRLKLDFLEQPTPAADISALAEVRKGLKGRIELLADESVFSPADAEKICIAGAADCLNIKLAKCGGITGALKIREVASRYKVGLVVGCMLEGVFSVTAAAHFSLNSGITRIDLDSPLLCENAEQTDMIFERNKIYPRCR